MRVSLRRSFRADVALPLLAIVTTGATRIKFSRVHHCLACLILAGELIDLNSFPQMAGFGDFGFSYRFEKLYFGEE